MIVETSFGPVRVWGRAGDPLVFVVRGAQPELTQLECLQGELPHVALVHLPGMHTPFFARNSVADFSRAFDEVLTALACRDCVVLGVSIGGVVALGMRHPSIRHFVLLDTPLTTSGLWPLDRAFRGPAERLSVARQWLFDLFGYSPGGWENRDYTGLLRDLTAPADLLVGGVPLGEPRPIGATPSLVSAADRATYRAHPLVQVEVVPGVGHNIPGEGYRQLVSALQRTSPAEAALSQ
jgi:pimeloyl-ACP methyl ester carboxylesterase